MLFESEKVEFKSQMLEDLYKEVIAFASASGSGQKTAFTP